MQAAPPGWPGDLDVQDATATAYIDLGAGEQTYTGEALVDYKVHRELVGDLPETVRGQRGVTAASLELVLAVPDEDVTQGWSPWTDTLRPGGAVRLTVGFGGVEVQKFTGKVLRVDAPVGSPTMRVRCIDPVIRCRDVTSLVYPLLPGIETNFGAFTCDWPLQILASAAGFRATPPLPDGGLVLSLPLQGSIRAEAWHADIADPHFAGGGGFGVPPFEASSGTVYFTSNRTYTIDNGLALKFGPGRPTGAVVVAGLRGTLGSVILHDAAARWFRLRRTATHVEAQFATSLANLDTSPVSLGSVAHGGADDLWAQVELDHNTSTGQCTYVLTVKGVGTASGSAAVGAGDWYWTSLILNSGAATGRRIAGVQVIDNTFWAHDLDAWQSNFYTAGAAALLAIPEIRDRVRWDVMADIARSELGAITVDDLGAIKFLTRTALLGGAPVADVTTVDRIAHVAWSSSLDALRSRILVDYHPVRVESSATVRPLHEFMFSNTDAGAVEEVFINLPAMVYQLPAPTPEFSLVSGIGKNEFKVYLQSDGSEVTTAWDAAGGDIAVELLSPTRAKMTITNPATGGPWKIEGNLHGQYRTWFDEPVDVIGDTGAAATYDVHADLDVEASIWRQDVTAATVVKDALVVDVATPRPVLDDVQIVADPLLQLADVITARDPIITGFNITALITAETISGGPGRLEHHVSLREI